MISGVREGIIQQVLDELESCDSESFAVGYAQSPHAVTWLRRATGRLLTPDGPLALDWVFDLRLFGPDGDLHWWWEGHHGCWNVLDDQAASARHWSVLRGHRQQPTRLIRGLAQADGAKGWTSMSDGKSAPFAIPIVLSKGGRAALAAYEYASEDSRHGTTDIVAERYTRLMPWNGASKP